MQKTERLLGGGEERGEEGRKGRRGREGVCCGFSMQRTERLQETFAAAGFLCILVGIRQETHIFR